MTALAFTAPAQDEPAFIPPANGSPSWLAHQLPSGWLIAALLSWLGLDQLLLWRFLDIMPVWAYPLGALLIVGLCVATVRAMPDQRGPTVATLIACMAVALILLMLGGEGRFFYANIDWQVRLAALNDMRINPWPFVYTARAEPDVLRFPIGMFLVPALAGKAWGAGAGDIALLLQNAIMLAMLLAMGSTLFNQRRERTVALAILIGFSGLDALGRILFRGGLSDHMENWAYLQYSSTITLAFWVPQHAMSGWIGATGYLLWRDGKASLAQFLTLLPLTALWSPLGLMGAMPFAALAGMRALIARDIRARDIGLPALALLLATPGLLYLGAANDDVGARLNALPPLQWGLFELLEVLVYAIPVALVAHARRFGMDTLVLLTLWLLAIPFVQIGSSTDFMMRGSVTALTILAVMLVDLLLVPSRARLFLIVALAVGALTPLHEIRRAVSHPAAPEVRCSFFMAWRQSFWFQPMGTYLAPISHMPALVRPTNPYRASAAEPARCWDGQWYHPDGRYGPPHSGGQDSVERKTKGQAHTTQQVPLDREDMAQRSVQ